MIKFKPGVSSDEFDKLDVRLQHIIFALAGFIAFHFKKKLFITSIYRDRTGSTHKHYRAIDFRIEPSGGSSIYTDEELTSIKKFCRHYKYDELRPRIPTLRVHGPVLHGHLQVNGKNKTVVKK